MQSRDFAQSLAAGQAGEGLVSRWIQWRFGAAVVPAYEKIVQTGKGPQVFRLERNLVAPDLYAFTAQRACWVEAKQKTHFTWHHVSRHWQTGIDRRHYHDYLQVARTGPIPVWLLFLHTDARPVRRFPSMPEACPTGLFGRDILALADHVDHEDSYDTAFGRTCPMVYWNVEDLFLQAPLDEVFRANNEKGVAS